MDHTTVGGARLRREFGDHNCGATAFESDKRVLLREDALAVGGVVALSMDGSVSEQAGSASEQAEASSPPGIPLIDATPDVEVLARGVVVVFACCCPIPRG
ncbi:hypothetical protein, partial [Agromyces humatus]